MHQHLRAPLALKRLAHVPQPVVALLEVLLQKDPAQRFQSPAELLKAMLAVTGAIEVPRASTRRGSRQKVPRTGPSSGLSKSSARRGPEKISVARLPVTGGQVFGREEGLSFLRAAWANPRVNVVTIVAWGGVGKSTLINHWLKEMAAHRYRSAELVFGWSFYRQGTGGGASSADEFLDAVLGWFGDPDRRLGTAWEKGERLARLVAQRRTLLVLDGLEPLQHPPGPQESRLREPCLQALLRELAAFNKGLCIITTRLAIADVAEYEGMSVLRHELEHLSSEAGAQLLRALGVKGPQTELARASEEFRGHCLGLTLLGSYLTDAYDGDIGCRSEVSEHLAQDVRQGVHARKVMESYQTWLGEGPGLAVLRMLGLFDRPADEKALGALLKAPAIPGLTESLTDLSPTEWRTILARLRRARLLAGEDPHNPGYLDAHPLVREYFGEQLRSQLTDAWQECNRRLFLYYRAIAPQLPDSIRDMDPLFLAVICGCHAGLYREALHEVYIPRIQRGNASFAANILGSRGALLSVLVHFFDQGRWGLPVATAVDGQSLTERDQLFILMQAALYLTVTRGSAAPEVRLCYERAESLCRSLNEPLFLYVALVGQWRYSLVTEKLTATMQIAKRLYSLAQDQNNSALSLKACMALAATLYYLGDFEPARQYAMQGVQLWRSAGVQSQVEEVDSPVIACLGHQALIEWHFGEIASCQATMAETISLAKQLNDIHALAVAIFWASVLSCYEHDPVKVERCASDLTELATQHHFRHWQTCGAILRGWARSTLGDAAECISLIEEGIQDTRIAGTIIHLPLFLALKAETLMRADRIAEALEAIREAEAVAERSGERYWSAELHRLRGVFLAAMAGDDAQIQASFREAIRIAKEQKSVSLEKRAEATYAEYRRQKAVAS
jgi:predicted ATPase